MQIIKLPELFYYFIGFLTLVDFYHLLDQVLVQDSLVSCLNLECFSRVQLADFKANQIL